jgi:zinc carboxypeptidase
VSIEISCGHPEANPQDATRIEQVGDAAYIVSPESEDGDSNYKFAFDVVARNDSAEPAALDLTVDWQEPPDVGTMYMPQRESIFVMHGDDWREVTAASDGDKVRYNLTLEPGGTRLGLHPPFGPDELEQFFADAGALPGMKRIGYGQSHEGLPVEAAWLPPTDHAERCVLAVGRIHPYETAGSFFVAGIADLLAGPAGEELRRSTGFVLAPMVNPDGVMHGLCKRTTTGTEISTQGVGSTDPAAAALRGLLCGVAAAAPHAVLIDAHGWMIPEDGPNFYRPGVGEKVLSQLGPPLFPHGWRSKDYSDRPPEPATSDLRRYAVDVLGMDLLVTSHPWWGRRPADMRKIGAELTLAFLTALDQ